MTSATAQQLGGQNVCAFLDTISVSEGTHDIGDDGYNVIVGGGLFTGYAAHPRIPIQTRWGLSDAAGRYQVMAAIPGKIKTDTWDWASRAIGVADFTPISQDLLCVYLVARRGALDDVKAGRIELAFSKCAKEWASLPGAGYGQHENSLDKLLKAYAAAGGRHA